jgi:hypothetical protein
MTTALTAVCNGTATTIGDRVATARPPKPGVCHSERAYIACRFSEIVWHVYGEIGSAISATVGILIWRKSVTQAGEISKRFPRAGLHMTPRHEDDGSMVTWTNS